jgi:hypothetical protein
MSISCGIIRSKCVKVTHDIYQESGLAKFFGVAENSFTGRLPYRSKFSYQS